MIQVDLTYALKLCLVGALVVGSVYMTEIYYERKLSDYQAEAQRQYAQALEAKALREEFLQGKINEAEKNAKQDAIQIQAHYEQLIHTANSISFDVSNNHDGDSVFGMHAESSGNKNSIPDITNATGRVSASAGKRAGTDGRKFQTFSGSDQFTGRSEFRKLYERQLMIARDCDITASHYNQLIKFYNEAREEWNYK